MYVLLKNIIREKNISEEKQNELMKGWGHKDNVLNIQLFLINIENNWVNNVKSVSHKFDKQRLDLVIIKFK